LSQNSTSFSTLPLQAQLLENVTSLGYEEMTPIQAQSLPHILAGKDVIGQGKTGSGKTAAFGLGLLNQLDLKKRNPQSLVLCPTRELADQVANALRQLARMLTNVKILSLCGGQPFRPQMSSLEHGAHIVVGTPGRVAKHFRSESLSPEDLKMFVLDEGDRMLEMGFQDEINEIVGQLPKDRQTLLFSATYPERIQVMAERVMNTPITCKVESTHDHASIEQIFYQISDPDQRAESLKQLLMEHPVESTIIFCTTKLEAKALGQDLKRSQFSCLALHGDLEQKDRDETLIRFANKSVSILVATDVASRGLDIDSIDLVINYHISTDVEIHVHRIGRTGRAGSEGLACSLFSDKEQKKISRLEEYFGQKIKTIALPLKKNSSKTKMSPVMISLKINSGKKQKLRAGNLLGALTGENGLSAADVGKIHIQDHWSCVAVRRTALPLALKKLSEEKWKGRPIQGWLLGE
jgi:ATP-independent RNA helicase DbpA